jgi:coproporphyrinogen III oxidase-like Fe-S oxidoreductase
MLKCPTYTYGQARPVCAVCCAAVQIEQGTPFARWYSGQGSPLPQEPEAVAMFEAASATLTAAGYQHYEVQQGPMAV